MSGCSRSHESGFTWSDAWLLQAIAMAARKQPAPLADVIAAGDAINHAIFAFEELEQGLGRLVAAGYVAEESGRFSVSPRFCPTYASLAKAAPSWTGVNNMLEAFLQSQPCVGPSEGELAEPVLTQADYDEAIKKLLRWRRHSRF